MSAGASGSAQQTGKGSVDQFPFSRGLASVHLAAILIVTLTAAIWQPDSRSITSPRAAQKPLAAAPRAVTIIDAAPRGKACSEQTWPYIERECLTYGPAEPAIAPKAAASRAIRTAGNAAVADVTTSHTAIAPPSPVPPLGRARERAASSTDDVSIADEADDDQPADEELRATAQAEERRRRRWIHQRDFFRHGHLHFGPFRF